MKKNISLFELKEILAKEFSGKKFVYDSENQHDAPSNITYCHHFEHITVKPYDNEIKLGDKLHEIKFRTIKKAYVDTEFPCSITVITENILDGKKDIEAEILVL